MTSPAEAAGATNGPFLYYSALKNAAGAVVQQLPFTLSSHGATARFSPDGTQLVDVTYDSATSSSVLEIRTNTGGLTELHPGIGIVQDVTWAPDGSAVAVLGGTSSTKSIKVLPVDGGPGSTLLSFSTTSDDFRLGSSLSWHPTDGRIAFIGTELPETETVEYPAQIYTVPSTGGSRSLYNSPGRRFCEGDCVFISYNSVDWAPDGSKVLVLARDDGTSTRFLGTIGQGEQQPARLRTLNGGFGNTTHWSPDGTEILFTDSETDGTMFAATMPASGGSETRLAELLYSDWLPCPDGACPDWSGGTEADLVASVRGLNAKSAAGTVDTVKATVTNNGPSAAGGVELRLGVPKGLTYGYVERPDENWSCDVTSDRFILCTAASLPAGGSATLTAGLHATKPSDQKRRIAVRVSSATSDPVLANNAVVDTQHVRPPTAPNPPSARQIQAARDGSSPRVIDVPAGRTSSPWVQVGKRSYNLWIRATDVYYRQMTEGGYVVQGAYSATLWAWEGGHSRTVRFEFGNELVKYEYAAISGWNLVKRGEASVPDTRSNSWAYFAPKPWIMSTGDADAYMRGHWKFVRAFHSRNVGVKFNLH